jgi:hypothetical protein
MHQWDSLESVRHVDGSTSAVMSKLVSIREQRFRAIRTVVGASLDLSQTALADMSRNVSRSPSVMLLAVTV